MNEARNLASDKTSEAMATYLYGQNIANLEKNYLSSNHGIHVEHIHDSRLKVSSGIITLFNIVQWLSKIIKGWAKGSIVEVKKAYRWYKTVVERRFIDWLRSVINIKEQLFHGSQQINSWFQFNLGLIGLRLRRYKCNEFSLWGNIVRIRTTKKIPATTTEGSDKAAN